VVDPTVAHASADAPASANGSAGGVNGAGRLSGAELERHLALVRAAADAGDRRHQDRDVRRAEAAAATGPAVAMREVRQRLERMRAQGADPLAEMED
jgi:hypothetical protein